MKYGYKKLFGVKLFHEYYSDGLCRGIKCLPTDKCARLLSDHRLVFNALQNGFEILYPQETGKDNTAIVVGKNMAFSFMLVVTNSGFFNFTDIGSGNGLINCFSNNNNQAALVQGSSKIYPGNFVYSFQSAACDTVWFELSDAAGNIISANFVKKIRGIFEKNIITNNDYPGKLRVRILNGNNILSDEIIFSNTNLFKERVFGITEIINPDPVNNINPPDYTINFKSRKDSWKYFIKPPKIVDDSTLTLEDRGWDELGNRYSGISFTFCERPCDKIVDGIKLRLFESGKMNNLVFVRQDIPFYEEKKQNLQLVKYTKDEVKANADADKSNNSKSPVIKKNSGTTIVSNLPNPSLSKNTPELFINL